MIIEEIRESIGVAGDGDVGSEDIHNVSTDDEKNRFGSSEQ